MNIVCILLIGLVVILSVVIFLLLSKISKLEIENLKIAKRRSLKDVLNESRKTSSAPVAETVEHFSELDGVMERISAGESKTSISEALDIPLSKIELIVKFDKLKKRD